jgi:hypothetical protein
MTHPDDDATALYVAVAAEADEHDLVADLVFRGQQVADIRRQEAQWVVTLYDPLGVEGFRVPLTALRAALEDAATRLGAADFRLE